MLTRERRGSSPDHRGGLRRLDLMALLILVSMAAAVVVLGAVATVIAIIA